MSFGYNLALVFDDVNNEILQLATELEEKNDMQFTYDSKSKVHATILKFETEVELTNEQKKQLIELKPVAKVNFAGITALPARSLNEDPGVWVEISLLDHAYLYRIVKPALKIIGEPVKVLNEIDRGFRPHITLGKTNSYAAVNMPEMNSDVVRRTNVQAKLELGKIGEGFSLTA